MNLLSNCIQCEKEYLKKKKNNLWCSPVCRDTYHNIQKNNIRFESKIENKEYISCKICGFKCVNLQSHIISKHNMTIETYKTLYKTNKIVCEDYSANLSEKVKGENNPAYNHGGRFSPFSKKFIYAEKYDPSELGKKTAETAKKNNNLNTIIDYYIVRGYSIEEAEQALAERQKTFTLEKCIDKHGEIEGTKRWKERQEKWQNTLNNKPLEEIQLINSKKITKSRSGPVSKAEKEIYHYLKTLYPEIKQQHHLKINDTKNNYFYDIILGNKIIEYNGDFWHCNPNIYSEEDLIKRNNTFISAKEIWEKDRKKIEIAKNSGFEVLVIWESDYKKNREEIINKCINFLTQ